MALCCSYWSSPGTVTHASKATESSGVGCGVLHVTGEGSNFCIQGHKDPVVFGVLGFSGPQTVSAPKAFCLWAVARHLHTHTDSVSPHLSCSLVLAVLWTADVVPMAWHVAATYTLNQALISGKKVQFRKPAPGAADAVPSRKRATPINLASAIRKSGGSGASSVVQRPVRDRVLHLLALRPYRKAELLLRLQKDGLTQADKDALDSLLQQVGTEQLSAHAASIF